MKQFATLLIAASLCAAAVPEASAGIKKFIKGNIAEKAAAVRESTGNEVSFLAQSAIDFALEHKQALGSDKELDALAAAGVLAFPQDALLHLGYIEKQEIAQKFSELFSQFTNETVRIALLNKIVALKEVLPTENFIEHLEQFLQNGNIAAESNIAQTSIKTLGEIGTSKSFSVIYCCKREKKWPQYNDEIDAALVSLADKSLPHILAIIHEGNVKDDIRPLFDLLTKSEKISASLKSEIAENVLSETIYIANNSSAVTRETVSLQLDALDSIIQNKWTRAAQSVLAFFELAEREYRAGVMTGDEFVKVVSGAAAVAPVDASSRLSSYLAELNKQTETGSKVPEKVALAVIDALGEIGDKSSFDTLLYVTYVNYPDMVVAAARDALARLKW